MSKLVLAVALVLKMAAPAKAETGPSLRVRTQSGFVEFADISMPWLHRI